MEDRLQGMEGQQRKEASRACCSDPGRDDGDTWTRMRALEVEMSGKIWDVSGRQRLISDLESYPLGQFPVYR